LVCDIRILVVLFHPILIPIYELKISVMGHLVGKEIYQKLGDKIDRLPFRVNKNKALFNILKELYTSEEADLVVNMPHALSSADQIEKAARIEKSKLNALLESLCTKGLVIDIWIDNKYYYMPSPMAIGIFEFTMMRTGDNLSTKKWAELLHEYLNDGNYYAVNFGHNEQISPMRVLHNQIFGNPEKVSQKIMKGLIGGFLKLSPVKKALMSEKLRSSFLYSMKKGAAKQNKEYLLEI